MLCKLLPVYLSSTFSLETLIYLLILPNVLRSLKLLRNNNLVQKCTQSLLQIQTNVERISIIAEQISTFWLKVVRFLGAYFDTCAHLQSKLEKNSSMKLNTLSKYVSKYLYLKSVQYQLKIQYNKILSNNKYKSIKQASSHFTIPIVSKHLYIISQSHSPPHFLVVVGIKCTKRIKKV